MNYVNVIIHYLNEAKGFINILPPFIFLFSINKIYTKMKTILFWFHALVIRVLMKQLSALYSPFKSNRLKEEDAYSIV